MNSPNAWFQFALFLGALLLLTKPLGLYLVQVLDPHGRTWLDRLVRPVERLTYRVCGIDPTKEQSWLAYTVALLAFSLVGMLFTYFILRFQHLLPLNPQHLPGLSPALAFNTAASFTTNTNWQSYAGESTMSYFSQIVGLTIHNFTSAAVGLGIAAALVRDVRAVGGVIDAEDLRACAARIVPATAFPWRNGRILQLATGLTAAPTLARVLPVMRDLAHGTAPDAAWYTTLATSLKTAYGERLAGLGAEENDKAETCTTHLTVVDADGTMVSMTTTLMSTMGSRVVLPETGVLLNNGIMWFDPRPGRANSIAPGKRPLTNMCPIIMAQDGRPVLAVGASGGRRIMASVFQMLAYVADFGMDPQTAAHYPRLDVSSPDEITADRRLGADVLAALAASGGLITVDQMVAPVNFACPNLILVQPDGTRVGISDVYSPWSAAVAQ